jgi:hypothetical protein
LENLIKKLQTELIQKISDFGPQKIVFGLAESILAESQSIDKNFRIIKQ